MFMLNNNSSFEFGAAISPTTHLRLGPRPRRHSSQTHVCREQEEGSGTHLVSDSDVCFEVLDQRFDY